MEWFKAELEVQAPRQGLHEFTREVETRIQSWGITEGMCHLFLQHTSASLLISENYDPTAKKDLEEFLKRMAPEHEPWYRHTLEGSDDSPSHMKALLTGISQVIPIDGGKLNLGTWQGIYLCEHRTHPQRRTVLLRCLKAA